MRPLRTKKQRIIMELIFKAAGEGCFLNIRTLHERLPYSCAYGSLRRSIEHLEANKFLVKERAGLSVLLVPTKLAYDWFCTGRGS
ncbi:hypothetical protein [Mesorhizobium sp.]|uniref:hypothetical protein n=1 Tax=Mesorhizobium sp. TaxID=1871066 RepID=UPI000FE96BFC|nr:hypothetical protein [Mesorhizobium sp.]RWI35413.1 MAG: hypothetical protein EOR14_28330 [Mesorhizobium sp.]RWJ66418.1 MAG: hypothetical protein EOR34_28805 [Mesorhizobium sp.]